ncbi:MAG: glycosyltransferase family 2 protein [Bacteroidota bacterium]
MELVNQILETALWVVFGYFSLGTVYILFMAVSGLFPYRPKLKRSLDFKKMAVLIPGYKEDAVIYEVARDALEQNYPKRFYDVIVIADSFQFNTIQLLRQLPIRVIEVSFDKSTKAKALNKALDIIEPDGYENIVVLDADNIMAKDFLRKINQAFQNGWKVVQGHRIAKNKNTPFAILDAINEEIINHFFRKAHRVLGMSAGLIGSAMAFEYHYFKQIMSTIHDVAGEDKEIELKILRDRVGIEYLEDAYVYDEKVQNAKVFSKQRTRWIASQVYYFKKYMLDGIWQLLTKGNVDFFDKALQTFIPPRILMLGALTLLTGLAVIFPFMPHPLWWLMLLASVGFGLIISVPGYFFNKDLIKAILHIPKAFFYMVKAMFSIKGAGRRFIHTPHTSSSELADSGQKR